ncbi:TB2/DP1, HVA22 family-domain-containing protein [Aspergillus floccosus]
MFGVIADLLSSIITILFPIFASFKALRSGDPSQLAPWLMYWVVLSALLMAESWTYFIVGWLPFYSWIRLFFFSYLVLPQTQGARLLYQTYVDPFLEHHEREIEDFIGRSHERAKALGLQYFYQALDWVRENILHLPAQRPASPPPPTGPASYAQSLLSRFNLPTSTTGMSGPTPAPNNDWFSAISSAVAAVTSTGKSPEARAEELSASGTLLPREMASMSREEKARYISNQRDLLDVVRNALAREERNLDQSPEDDLAYGSASSLRKNRSDNSFDHIQPEDVRDRSPSGRGGGNWTSGWFGGEHGGAAASGVEFAARTVEEIARSRSTRS